MDASADNILLQKYRNFKVKNSACNKGSLTDE